MNNRQRGKNTERALANRIKGAKRIGILGKEDLEHPVYSFEAKHRKRCVVESWMFQAIRNCPKGKCPAVIIHIHGKEHKNDLVVTRLEDFQDWNGELGKKG